MSLSVTDPATTDIYTLSLHDALPICASATGSSSASTSGSATPITEDLARQTVVEYLNDVNARDRTAAGADRKSTRLNSSHANISYAVFCLKKKKNKRTHTQIMQAMSS